MRLLLDTHAFLWFVTNDPKLSENALDAIAEDIPIVSVDSALDAYGVQRRW